MLRQRERHSVAGGRGRTGLATIALVVLGLLPASAAGEDRYVTPAGAGELCTLPSPCALDTGVSKAVTGDTVHVAGDLGPYLDVPFMLAHSKVTVIGEGQTVPQIVFTEAGHMTVDAEASVTRLDLTRASGVQVLVYLFGTGSRLTLESAALPAFVQGLLRDSFVRSTGPGTLAVEATTAGARLSNVTAVAEGPGAFAIGADAQYDPLFEDCIDVASVELRNVIARGTGGDLRVQADKECPADVDVAHSNYRAGAVSIVGAEAGFFDLGGNQTTVDPLLGPDGLHQLPGSPTIDAGVATPDSGPVDIDGEPRAQGSAPDIGADELLAIAPGPAPDATAPVGAQLRFKPRRFRPRRSRPASIATTSAKKGRRRAPQTSRVSYRLSEDARVRFIVRRRVIGRKKGKRCVIGKRARRLRKAKKCKRFVRVKGAFTHTGKQGANRFRFSGYVRGRRLRPGVYRMAGVPTDAAGNRGRRFGGSFVVARR